MYMAPEVYRKEVYDEKAGGHHTAVQGGVTRVTSINLATCVTTTIIKARVGVAVRRCSPSNADHTFPRLQHCGAGLRLLFCGQPRGRRRVRGLRGCAWRLLLQPEVGGAHHDLTQQAASRHVCPDIHHPVCGCVVAAFSCPQMSTPLVSSCMR
jgi:hypothetical protein